MTTIDQTAAADRSGSPSATPRHDDDRPASTGMTAVPRVSEPRTQRDQAADPCGDDCGCGGAARAEDPPIACTLDPGQQGSRVQEWTALLGAGGDPHAGVVARRAIDGGVRLELGPSTDVAEVARLAAAEQDCCRFFRFVLSIDTRGIALEVRAPAEAIEVVTALFGAPA